MKRMFIFILCLSLAVLFFLKCKKSQDPISDKNKTNEMIILTNGFLINGTGADPISNVRISIKDKWIRSIDTDSCSNIPEKVQIIDIPNSYILPGIMNTHVHGGYKKNNRRMEKD